MTETPIISLKNVEKFYQHGLQRSYVLRRVSLDFKPGEFVSIMGPSGAGKSTLLHILGMHDASWTGEYFLHGQPIHSMGKRERADLQKKHVGFVFQSYHLLDHLTVYENLDMPLSYRDVKKKERDAWSATCSIASRSREKRSLPVAALGRPAAARRRRARADLAAGDHPGRRADRQPALGAGPRDHGALPEAERGRDDDPPGDAFGDQRCLRIADRAPA